MNLILAHPLWNSIKTCKFRVYLSNEPMLWSNSSTLKTVLKLLLPPSHWHPQTEPLTPFDKATNTNWSTLRYFFIIRENQVKVNALDSVQNWHKSLAKRVFENQIKISRLYVLLTNSRTISVSNFKIALKWRKFN